MASLPINHLTHLPMRYLLLLLTCFAIQPLSAQETSRAATPVDTAEYVIRLFEGRLTRLREAVDKNDVSSMVGAYAHLLGDIREEIGRVESANPKSARLESMLFVFNKFEAFIFDPAKPEELKPYLPRFDEFLALMREEKAGK